MIKYNFLKIKFNKNYKKLQILEKLIKKKNNKILINNLVLKHSL